jgi:transposase
VASNRNVCRVTLLFDQAHWCDILNWRGERLPSNLTNWEYARLGPLIPAASPGRQPRKTDMRAAMNAILYLPRDGFPPHSTGPEHLPQIPRRWGVGSNLDEVAHGASRTPWAGRQPNRRRARQPVAEVGKGSGKDDARPAPARYRRAARYGGMATYFGDMALPPSHAKTYLGWDRGPGLQVTFTPSSKPA